MIGRIVRRLARTSTIRRQIVLWDAAGHDRRPYCCTLIFEKRDPFAVRLLVPNHSTGRVAEIVFARGLLIDGADQPVGDGAVRVEPHIVDSSYSTLTLPVTRDGTEFYTKRAPLDTFVADSCALVPSGRERPRVNAEMDRWLAKVTA